MKRIGAAMIAILAIACEKVDTGIEPDPPNADFSKYVSMGTSVTMGFASDGVNSTTQETSWAKLLADDVGATFTLPLIDAPGCPPPLRAPLGLLMRIDNSSISTTTTCAPNSAGVTLPAQNVALTGQTAGDAVTANPPGGTVAARVIPISQTQVSAMRSQSPTFVSVEFGANEVFRAFNGLASSAVPFSTFSANYTTIINNVEQTGAKALLALLPADVSTFPALRTSAEIASQRTGFGTLNVSVNANCDASSNLVALTKILSVMATGAARAAGGLGPADFSCADVPGSADGILTAADVTTLNALMAQMNTFITAQATAIGYATFSLGTLYDTAKSGNTFDLLTVLTSTTPFGARFSLDGVHPSLAGHQVLMAAAKAGIIAKYGSITK